MNCRLAALCALLLLAAPGCGTRYMRPANPGEMYEVPPEGMALVNFHRPSGYGGGREYTVFDSTTFVGLDLGHQRFQLVAEPGVHYFIGSLTRSMWATVSVIHATLEAGQIYDCVVDAGYFTSSIAVVPMTADQERREDIAEWEEDDERPMMIDELSRYKDYEADRHDDNLEIIADFVNGDKKERLKLLTPADARKPGEFND
jgi:hypothetical protein